MVVILKKGNQEEVVCDLLSNAKLFTFWKTFGDRVDY